MKPGNKHKSGKRQQKEPRAKVSTSKREEVEIKNLETRIAAEAPAPGSLETDAVEFKDLPLSTYTMTGLNRYKFTSMTQIQRIAILHALAGRDILGAAKTGSGKTLAYVVPLLERLYRERWTSSDGPGALIISPTRELAMQIFEVVKNVGHAHFSMSAGLITGGKDFEEERQAIQQLSILVATPGRLLQHLEQTADLDLSELRVLVLDEADRLLDMGFSATLNSILSYCPPPPQRQTLLFSATQTKSVKDLARLSLTAPQYLAVHEAAQTATPARLAQHYVVCKLEDKLNLLFSFLRSHLKNKTVVFMSSCKQARFMFEAFRRLRPGIPLQVLHGKMKMKRRMLVYYDFLKKPEAALFCTDVAARGLDFPGVDWVLQLDCPEDPATYIHRVGRTARFHSKGHALAVLLPSEAPAMVPALTAAKIPLAQIHINPSAAVSITGKLAAEVAADTQLKQMAQKAFSSYLRSVLLQANKEVFKLSELPLDAYAESLGLATTPEVAISKKAMAAPTEALRQEAHKRKNENKALMRLKQKIAEEKAKRKAEGGSDDDEDDDDDDEDDSDEDGSDSDSDGSDSDSDSDEDDEEDGAAATATLGGKFQGSKASKAKAKSKGGNDDEEDELLRPKKKSSSAAAAAAEDDDADDGGDADGAAEEDLSVDADLLAGLSAIDKKRIFAVIRDTKALGKRAVLGDKGLDGLTPFQRIALAKAVEAAKAEGGAGSSAAGSSSGSKSGKGDDNLQSAASSYAERVAARLKATATADREAERDRVRRKHKEEKARLKGRTDDDEEEGEGEEEEEEVEEGEQQEESGSGSGSGSDSGSDSDDDSDGDSSSDSSSDGSADDDGAGAGSGGAAAAAASAGGGAGHKRKRGDAFEGASAAAGKANGGAGKEKLEDVEAAALEMLSKKRRAF